MKKRILTTVLLLICMVLNLFLATSCGEEEESEFEAFEAAIENTVPTNVSGEVKLATGNAIMTVSYTAVIASDGTFTVDYSYNKLNDIGSGAASDVYTTVTGTVTYDGQDYTGVDGLAAKLPANAVATSIDLEGDMEYVISSDGKVLSATVAAEDTEDVFGIDYGTEVRFVLTQANEKVVSLALIYTLESGEVVEAICNYN